MPETNHRFTDLGGGVIGEMISNQTQLFYNPATQQAEAHFNCRRYINTGEVMLELAGFEERFAVELSTRMYETPCIAGDVDPVFGTDLTTISIAGVMTILKRFFDTEYNARFQVEEPPPEE